MLSFVCLGSWVSVMISDNGWKLVKAANNLSLRPFLRFSTSVTVRPFFLRVQRFVIRSTSGAFGP